MSGLSIYLWGERWVNPLPDETSTTARHGQLAEQFYLFIQTPLDRRGMASLQSNSTFPFKHHLTGEGHCCPSVSAHPANHICCSSNIAIADHFPSKTFSFKHHWTGEAYGQLAEQFYLFFTMFGQKSNSNFSHFVSVMLHHEVG